MGLLFSRFKKRHRTSREILEELDHELKVLSQRKQRSVQYEKSFIGYLLIISFLTYLVGAVIFYCYFLPHSWTEGILNSLPLLLFPLVVYLVKRLLNVYFTHQKAQYDLKMRTLQEEKRKAVNEMMERETYNTALELLQRFEPQHPSLRATPPATPTGRRARAQREGGEIRQRRPQQPPHPAFQQRPVVMATPHPASSQPVAMAMPAPPPQPSTNSTVPQSQVPAVPLSQFIPPGMCLGPAPGPPVPCPILPRNRSNMDKVVEYLVGDGPNNRYALVCSECHSHNGMALGDEFEYLSFRCAYCYHFNPARKRKPSLPPAPPQPEPPRNTTTIEPTGTAEGPAHPGPPANGSHGDEGAGPHVRHRHRQHSSAESDNSTATAQEL